MLKTWLLRTAVLLLLPLGGCVGLNPPAAAPPPAETTLAAVAPKVDDIQRERDEIYSLLAYGVVLKNWQEEGEVNPRGFNIGSVLVDSTGKVVFWARNANTITGNDTQHGEVRLIRNYLATVGSKDFKDHVVYTTLEPCAMCSGMMALTNIGRTVYGQKDPSYGDALERLALDSSAMIGGFKPYPRGTPSMPSTLAVKKDMDKAYKKYQKRGGEHIHVWLRSPEAKNLYIDALNQFKNYRVTHPENQAILSAAQAYYQQVPDRYTPLPQ